MRTQAPALPLDRVLAVALPLAVAAAYVAVMLGVAATSADPWVLAVPATALAAWIGAAASRSAARDRWEAGSPRALDGLGAAFVLAAVLLPVLTVIG